MTSKIEALEARVQTLIEHIIAGMSEKYTIGEIGAAFSILVGTALATEDHDRIDLWLDTFCKSVRAQALRASVDLALAEARQGAVQ